MLFCTIIRPAFSFVPILPYVRYYVLDHANFARLLPPLIKTTCRECAGRGGAGPPRPPLPLWDRAAAGERPHNVLYWRLAEALRHLSPSCRLGKVKDQKEYRSLTVLWIRIRWGHALSTGWIRSRFVLFVWDKCTVSEILWRKILNVC
jgi:hypothetical protein